MALLSSGLCDIGMKRKNNQDSIYLGHEHNIFVVADGMGGHNGGEVASALAVQHIPSFIIKNKEKEPSLLIKESIEHANLIIKQHGEQEESLSGMGTTCVSLLFHGPTLYTGNVGDSRAYLINSGRLFPRQ